MLLIDGVRYDEYAPKNEDEFEHMVSEHALEIFGEHSLYFDRKLKLQSLSGVGSIPDGYAIIVDDKYEWHIIEIELSSHPLYNHIVPQISRFISGINNPSTRKTIIEALYHALIADEPNYFKMDKVIQTGEYYKFVTDIVSNSPVITVVIEKDTPELHDALESLNHPKINIVEFRTFTREGVGLEVHAHLFVPLYKRVEPLPPPPSKVRDELRADKTGFPTTSQDTLDVVIRNPYFINFHLFMIPKDRRSFFPGYKISFTLETDIGEMKTHVTSARKGTEVGYPNAAAYIQANLVEWYRSHPSIKVGDKVTFKAIEPNKRYSLEIVK